MRRFLPLLLACSLAAGAGAAAVRGPLASLEPGRWSVSRSATGSQPANVCVSDFAQLAQWEHRGQQCRRTFVSSAGSDSVVRYNCSGGDFGQARMTVLTPRSLSIETQGIHSGLPFHYELFARKSGACAHH